MTDASPLHSREPGEPLDRYLDHLMSAIERAEFEARLAAEPALAAELHRQQQVDAALREYAAPSSPARILTALHERIAASDAPGTAKADRPRLHTRSAPAWRRFAVAAVFVLGVVGAWQVLRLATSGPAGEYDPGPHRTMVQAYHDTIEGGFNANWTCRDDAVFAMVFKDQLGQMLSMNLPLPPNTLAMGLNYFDIFSRRTIGMLAEVSGEPVMIFVDRVENDRQPQASVQDGLHVFRRELGSLVLYEVTPLDEPGLVHHLRVPDELPSGVPEPPQR